MNDREGSSATVVSLVSIERRLRQRKHMRVASAGVLASFARFRGDHGFFLDLDFGHRCASAVWLEGIAEL